MPVLTSAGSDLGDLHLSGTPNGHQHFFFRLGIYIGIFIFCFATLALLQKLLPPQLSNLRSRNNNRGNPRNSGAASSRITYNSGSVPDCVWLQQRGQGQGPSAKETAWAISRLETSGTAPDRPSGAAEGGNTGGTEETTDSETSHGVSTDFSYGIAQQPYGHGRTCIEYDFLAAAAAATVARSGQGPADEGSNRMENDDFQECPGFVYNSAGNHSTSPFSGRPDSVFDDGRVLHKTDDASDDFPALPSIFPVQQPFKLNMKAHSPCPPPKPPRMAVNNVYSAHQTLYQVRRPLKDNAHSISAELETVRVDNRTGFVLPQGQTPGNLEAQATNPQGRSKRTQSPKISSPRRTSYDTCVPSPVGAGVGSTSLDPIGGVVGIFQASSNACFSPSPSHPSSSLSLPPPLPFPQLYLDPAEVMFPNAGLVMDGGFRTVYADHSHHDSGPVDGACDEISDGLGHPGASWKNRHTRVYRGGVCAACAAADEGGFYGASVRPEDKR